MKSAASAKSAGDSFLPASKIVFLKFRFFAMKSLLLLASLFLPLHLAAQIEKILEDPSVNWAAEIELTLPADLLQFSANQDRSAAFAVLKLAPEYEPTLDGYVFHSLNAKLWEIAENEEWEAYANAELTRLLDADELLLIVSGPDTIVTVDPNTYEEKVQIGGWGHRELPFEMPFVKVRQLLTYNDEKAQFGIHTLAIAPFTGSEAPRFWLKVPETETFGPDTLFARPDVTWAARYVTLETSPRVSNFQILKDETGPVMDRFFDRIMADTAVALYANPADEMPMAGDKRACLFSCTDSVSTFDPESFVEHVEVFHTELLPDQIIDLQLIQEFFWQEEDGLLYTRLVAVAPRYRFFYQEGQWYPRVGFYRRCDE